MGCGCDVRTRDFPAQTKQLADRLDLTRSLYTVQETGRFIARGHKALRRDELSTALGVDGGSADRATVDREMAQARRCAAALGSELRGTSRAAEFAEANAWLSQNQDAASRALASARGMFVDSLRESELPVEDALEGVRIWDAAVERISGGDLTSLFDWGAELCGELEGALQEGEDWGRRPHSPIETWQWIVIAIILVIAVALVIVCLIWFGCSWFYWIFVGACVATGAFGGWIGLCVGFGF